MKNSLLFCIKKFYRNKKNVITSFLLAITISLFLLISTYYSTTKNFVNTDIKEDMFYVTLLVAKNSDSKFNVEKEKHKLEQFPNVVGVFSTMSRYNGLISKQFITSKTSGRVDLYAGNNNSIPKIIKGTNFPNDDNNYIICPMNFFPNDMDYKNLTRNDFINIEDYLNKTISFEYENFISKEKKNIEYKLVGIYENNPNSIDESICYVNEKSLLEVFKFQREGEENLNFDDQRTFYVQVNNSKNVDKVSQNLKNEGYFVMPTATIEYSYFDNIFENIKKMVIILSIILMIEIIVILYKLYKDDIASYKLLSIFGITRKRINRLILWNNFLLVFIGCAFSIIISTCLQLIIQLLVFYKPLIFEKRDIIINYSYLPYVIIGSILLSLLVSLIIIIVRNKEKNEIDIKYN